MEAPMATASSGLTPLDGSRPKTVLTVSTTCGIRVMPPTRMTSLMSEAIMLASARASLQRSMVRWVRGAVSNYLYNMGITTRTIVASQARTRHTVAHTMEAIELGRKCTDLCKFVLLLARQPETQSLQLSFSLSLQAHILLHQFAPVLQPRCISWRSGCCNVCRNIEVGAVVIARERGKWWWK